jgi:hypothetical protein
MRLVTSAFIVLALAAAPAPGGAARGQDAAQGGWLAFEGDLTASGQRQSLPTGAERAASTAYLSGSLVLNGAAGIGRGFRCEAIAFDDGSGVAVGRAVWTDERGDRIYSRLNGDAMRAGRRVVGTITGGTGRYGGAEGEYAFEWRLVLEPESGAIHGTAVGLKGRVRQGGAAK